MRKLLIAGLAIAASLVGAATAAADWAPAATASIHPGVMTYTDGAQCTANGPDVTLAAGTEPFTGSIIG